MDNATVGKTVVLSNDGFEVFEMVSTDFALPCPVPRAFVALPALRDEDEFACFLVKGGL